MRHGSPTEVWHELLRERGGEAPVIYYPGSGTDAEPFQTLATQLSCGAVIYSDYTTERDAVTELLSTLQPWTVEAVHELTPEDLGVDSWEQLWFRDPASHEFRGSEHAYAVLAELSAPPDRRLAFAFFGTEAVGTFEVLRQAGVCPSLVVLQDHGFGCNWTRFGEGGELFDLAKPSPPEFLYAANNTRPWPGYRQIAAHVPADGTTHARALYQRIQARPGSGTRFRELIERSLLEDEGLGARK